MPTAFIVDPFEILDTGSQTVLKKRLETHFGDIATMGHTPLFKVLIISGAARVQSLPGNDPSAGMPNELEVAAQCATQIAAPLPGFSRSVLGPFRTRAALPALRPSRRTEGRGRISSRL